MPAALILVERLAGKLSENVDMNADKTNEIASKNVEREKEHARKIANVAKSNFVR